MNRTFALSVVALLAVSVLVPFAASADQGLTLWVFAGPDTAGLGDPVTIHVEAYLFDQPVDLDNLNVTAGFSSDAVNMTHTATGKWQGTYNVSSDDAQYGFLSVDASGDASNLAASDSAYLFLSSGGMGGWDIVTRLGNYGDLPAGVSPGSSVLVEARTYYDGTLTEGGVVNMTVVTVGYGAMSQNTEHVVMNKTADGVYQHTIQVPASLAATQVYSLEIDLGPSGDLASDSQTFTAQPFPVLASIDHVASTSADAHFVVGLDSPVAGANVSMTGTNYIMTPPYIVTFGPFTGTTGPDGQATVHINWTGTAPTTLEAVVTSSGKTVGFPLVISSAGGTQWTPSDPLPYGCDVTLQSDPTGVDPGTTAHLTLMATVDGTALPSTPVTVFLGRDAAMGWTTVTNKTTDAQGDVNVDYAVPSDWSYYQDSLSVALVCPSGDVAKQSEHIGSPGPLYTTGDVTITAASTVAAGSDLAVSIAYTGNMSVTGAYGFAVLVPGSDPSGFVTAIQSGAIGSNLSSGTGTTFTGSVHVPSAMPTGNYTLFVLLTNRGATSERSNEFQEGGFSQVQVTSASGGDNGNGNNGTGGSGTKGFLPGFEAETVAAAVAAVAIGAASFRRLRDE